MLFDTGSAVVYAMSDKCLKNDCPESMEKYDTRSKSLMDHKSNRQELNYGQGFVSGTIGEEKLCFNSGAQTCLSNM